MTGTITIIMVFSIPLAAIITSHLQKTARIKHAMIADQIQLEKLKHENFLLETEKMRLELDKMKLENPIM